MSEVGQSVETDATEVREVWAIRWPDGSVSAGQYSEDGSDYAEQMVRMLAGDGAVVRRTVTITRTPWIKAGPFRVGDLVRYTGSDPRWAGQVGPVKEADYDQRVPLVVLLPAGPPGIGIRFNAEDVERVSPPDPERAGGCVMSAEIDALRQAVAEMDDEWSRDRAMGQDRTEWGTWRALIGWLTNVADRMPYADRPTPEQSHAVHIACTYLGRIDPRETTAGERP